MKPESIGVVLITWNEAPNIARTLAALSWAVQIVAVDSGSDDGTLDTLEAHPHVQVLHRRFDSFARQCAAGHDVLDATASWVLSLDADHIIPPELASEISSIDPAASPNGYSAA